MFDNWEELESSIIDCDKCNLCKSRKNIVFGTGNKNADILFMSNAAIVGSEEAFLKQLVDEYHPEIIVIGMGNRGCILYDGLADEIYKLNAVTVRPVVNTVGAGDALFSSFLHYQEFPSIRLSNLS